MARAATERAAVPMRWRRKTQTAKPEDEDRLLKQVFDSFGSGYALAITLEVKNVLRRGGDADKRKELLKARLPDLALDALQSNQSIVDLSVEFPGAPGRVGGRAKGSVKPAARTPAPNLRPGPGFKPDRKFITPEEFRKLPDKGRIDPQRVRTSQDSFSNRFKKEEIAGKGEVQRTVDELAARARAGADKNVPPIRLVEWKGFVYSPDHRRLVAYRRSGKDIQYAKTSFLNLNEEAQKRVLRAETINNNGSFIRSRDTNLME